MKIEDLKIVNTWRDVADAARTTIGKDKGEKEPSSSWKIRMIKSEHSPIRKMFVSWKWVDIPYFVVMHLVRHKVGIEHFVSTQRSDRTGVKRDELPQGALVTHECMADIQSIINISRKRLCFNASKETREAWEAFLEKLNKIEPEIVHCCVPDCIYRGTCREFKTCGYYVTRDFSDKSENYDKNTII